MKKLWVSLTGIIALIYLMNPTAGLLEFIPDNIPVIGNLDEGIACYILYSCVEFFRGKKIGVFKED